MDLERNDASELYDTNEQNRKRQTQGRNLWLPGVRMGGRDSLGVWDGHAHTAIFKTNNQ